MKHSTMPAFLVVDAADALDDILRLVARMCTLSDEEMRELALTMHELNPHALEALHHAVEVVLREDLVEDDGQPTEYEEWQDYYGGDDWDHGQYGNEDY